MKAGTSQFTLSADGWCRQARITPSPNFDPRPDNIEIDLLVIHNISLPPGKFDGNFISALFCNTLDYDADPYFDRLRGLRVSAHFLIRRNGELTQFVSTKERAWHAGQSHHAGRVRCNDFSIGIELEGADNEAFTDPQYDVLVKLTNALLLHYPLEYIVGHSDIAPVRKTDPGPCFEWSRYQSLLSAVNPVTKRSLRFP